MTPKGWVVVEDVQAMLYEKFMEFETWKELKRMVEEEKDWEGNPQMELTTMRGRTWVRAKAIR